MFSYLFYFRFPLKDPILLKKWLKNLRWKDWKPAPNSKICSDHFEKKCFIVREKRKRLHSWAVPTIFSFPNRYLERKVCETFLKHKANMNTCFNVVQCLVSCHWSLTFRFFTSLNHKGTSISCAMI